MNKMNKGRIMWQIGMALMIFIVYVTVHKGDCYCIFIIELWKIFIGFSVFLFKVLLKANMKSGQMQRFVVRSLGNSQIRWCYLYFVASFNTTNATGKKEILQKIINI